MNHEPKASNLPSPWAGQSPEPDSFDRPQSISGTEEDFDNYRSKADFRNLLESADRVGNPDAPVNFNPERQKQFALIRQREIDALALELSAPSLSGRAPTFTGGEHEVFECERGASVIKRTLPGFYGRILHEVLLLDTKSYQNHWQLTLRGALPSEYLRRWALTHAVFGLPTTYLGCTDAVDGERQIVVFQPYIEQNDEDPATLDDIEDFMTQHGFTRVEKHKIAIQEISEVSWYRQADGILIADAHARNFRKDANNGALIPVDLMVAIVPQGFSKLLPDPQNSWPAQNEGQAI